MRHLISFFLLATCPQLLQANIGAQSQSQPQWEFLQNEHLKIGLDTTAAAAVGWLSHSSDFGKNLINTYDRGRYLQQSYYGDPDASEWNGKPWRYNPVQGGDWRNQPAKLLELTRLSPTSIRSISHPRHWASGHLLEDVTLTQTVTLQDHLVHIAFSFSTTSSTTHKAHHQELPALFVQPEFSTLVHPISSIETRRTIPELGKPNSYLDLPQPWCAWMNQEDLAIGILSPNATQATCYRVPAHLGTNSGCSYVAPIATFAITPRFKYQYEIWLSIDQLSQLEQTFQKILKSLSDAPQPAHPAPSTPAQTAPTTSAGHDSETSHKAPSAPPAS